MNTVMNFFKIEPPLSKIRLLYNNHTGKLAKNQQEGYIFTKIRQNTGKNRLFLRFLYVKIKKEYKF